MFHDRADAGRKLAARFRRRQLADPLVLAIPRGGVVTGAVLAEILGAELDVVLSRKLRAPYHPEFALGAISEDGHVYLNPDVVGRIDVDDPAFLAEQRHQLDEISRRGKLFREVRPAAQIEERSVIVTDDGIATGSTMIAALKILRTCKPRELIVAVPVAPPARLAEVSRYADDTVCLLVTEDFYAISQFYDDFEQVEDAEAVDILRRFTPTAIPAPKQ